MIRELYTLAQSAAPPARVPSRGLSGQRAGIEVRDR